MKTAKMKAFPKNPRGNKQKGATLMDFLLWAAIAAVFLAGVVQLYVTGSAYANRIQTVTAVTSIKAGAESVKTINHTGVNMAKVCDERRNAVSMKICGDARNGVGTNPYGGNYTLEPDNSNLARIKVGVSNVDTQYIDALADSLASLAAGNCTQAAGCSTLTVSGNTITVTM
ncbi:hypothetical protein [Aliivibrio fischeri]|uniref:Type 4 secretion system PilS N-terminal domain-containing protein n=1 Tax=Aliivibrio fischeri TaxID=668 RepID=A0A510UL82_ALIFS|nr:hypothetical protein [Aliivibrio fischeri]GEK15413.1 hypothetical protein AFI02nite_34490 [Aliivibrio fischeri]